MSVAKGYKQTNVPWCEQIPADWEVQPLFTRYRERWEKNWDESVSDVLSLSYGRIVPRDVSTNYGLLPESFSTYQIVYEDDIIIRPTDMQNDHVSLRVGRSRQKGIITSAYISLIPYDLDPGYAHFLLHAYDLMKIFYQIGGGVRHSLKFEDIKRLEILVPPLDEQKAIAKYLESETARIDELIEKKRRLIELLREERAAITNQAVTRGLDPNAELKPSGIDWRGDIPKHWDVKRLKFVASIKYGLGQPPNQHENGLPIIRATNVEQGRISEKDLILVDPEDVPSGRDAVLKAGDIIVVRSGAGTADSSIIPQKFEGAIAGYDMVARAFAADPEFVAYCLLSNYIRTNQLEPESLRAAQPHLNKEELGDALILLPGTAEQAEIVSYLDHRNAEIDATISKIETEIDLIKEYRTALISEVVTGKIKVF